MCLLMRGAVHVVGKEVRGGRRKIILAVSIPSQGMTGREGMWPGTRIAIATAGSPSQKPTRCGSSALSGRLPLTDYKASYRRNSQMKLESTLDQLSHESEQIQCRLEANRRPVCGRRGTLSSFVCAA